MTRIHRLTLVLTAVSAAALAACSATTEESSVRRGDQAFAQGKYEEALAEYRLALRQGADDALTLARVAHTYAVMDRVDDAGSFYADAVQRDSTYLDEAVSDLMRMAMEARARKDYFAMASAVDRALKMRPGLGVSDMALDLARHYFQRGEYGRALPFYQKALAEATDSAPEIIFEVGQAHEEIGDCEHALVFFERYRTMLPRWKRSEVDWYIGTCSFDVARDIRAKSVITDQDLEAALQMIERTLELGVPRNIQAQAWFEKGDILSDLGDCSGAMDAYAQVRTADNPGALLDRAQARYDEIRFGRGLESFRSGRCR
ncbi:MAG: tetratricopeptide repeat protein [Gemmatimonadetes bacterium]|nr:tetratricopeptide repeat protein [Gemmatimonadota bacterium]